MTKTITIKVTNNPNAKYKIVPLFTGKVGLDGKLYAVKVNKKIPKNLHWKW